MPIIARSHQRPSRQPGAFANETPPLLRAISLDKLTIRAGPNLDSAKVGQLRVGKAVLLLNEQELGDGTWRTKIGRESTPRGAVVHHLGWITSEKGGEAKQVPQIPTRAPCLVSTLAQRFDIVVAGCKRSATMRTCATASPSGRIGSSSTTSARLTLSAPLHPSSTGHGSARCLRRVSMRQNRWLRASRSGGCRRSGGQFALNSSNGRPPCSQATVVAQPLILSQV